MNGSSLWEGHYEPALIFNFPPLKKGKRGFLKKISAVSKCDV